MKEHFEDFLDVTETARIAAERRRDYRDLKQWTTAEAEALQERGQAPIVFDQVGKKVDAIVGMEVQRRTDPKALPVKPRHEKAADAITDALRYVESKTGLDCTATDVFEDKLVEGYGAAIIEAEGEDITITRIPWDRYYYDPHSRRFDFSDKKYDGITLWMDLEDAKDMFPGKEDELQNATGVNSDDGTTFEDRPSNWIDRTSVRVRVRVNQEYHLKGGVWHETFYTGDVILKTGKSPYLDHDGKPTNPIEAECDFIDRENNRYGWVERLMDPQDEMNHRRSKALFMLSSVSVMAEEGAFAGKDRYEVLQELRKGMSFTEYARGSEVTIDRQQELGQSQLAFYQEAKQAMDSVGINPELTGQTDAAVSGRAFIARQQGGMAELVRIFSRHSDWKTAVYRQVFARMKQFWPGEKWIRVSGEQQATRFIGLNIPVTAIEKEMEQRAGMQIDEIRRQVGDDQVDQFIAAAVERNPAAGQVVETRNNIKEMHMDITIEEAPDSTILRDEQFQVLAQLAGSRADPQMFKALLMLSAIPNKDEVLGMFEEQQNPELLKMQMAQQALNMEGQQAENMKKQAEAAEKMSQIPLNEARAKDELASATERVAKISGFGV